MNTLTIKELGHVVLYVTSLERSANFYRDTLGFHEIARDRQTALFSSGRTHHELLLIEIDPPSPEDFGRASGNPKQKSRPEPGLYHIGFKIGNTDEELRTAIHELETKKVTIIGTADHTVTHSLYILDPDGNELELYVDVSDEWKTDPRAVLRPTKHLEL